LQSLLGDDKNLGRRILRHGIKREVTMKHLLTIFIALAYDMIALSFCMPHPSPVDAADCRNIPSSGPKIKIENPWTLAGESEPAAFMTIHNCGNEDDALVKAASNLGGTTTLMSSGVKDGKFAMSDVTQVAIPAGKKVEFKSNSYHVMFKGPAQTIKDGDRVELTLSFQKAGDIQVTSRVKSQ
jgi:periplasmic copper chaperone A